jgi:pimeloyl-ACP methyl ester carboxylesterase
VGRRAKPEQRFVRVRRSGAGPAVLLLHGQPGSGADWARVVPLIAGHDVVVPDRPGYGVTGGRAAGFRANAKAMIALLDRLGVESVVVAGHSWGGGVAIAMAESHPSRVAAMVLVSSVAPGGPTRIDDRILAAPLVGEVLAGATIGLAGFVLGSTRLRELSGLVIPGRSRDTVHMLASLTQGGAGSRVWRSFVVEQRALRDELASLAPGLQTISTPTMVVHGDTDHVVPLSTSRRLADSIPGATRLVLAGAGHFLVFDHPAAVASAVMAASNRSRLPPLHSGKGDQTAR